MFRKMTFMLTLASALHPLGLPFSTALPTGVLDMATEVRAHDDRFIAYGDVTPDSSWLVLGARSWTQSEALTAARHEVDALGLADGARLLVVGAATDAVTLLAILALPLVVRGSVVLLTDPGVGSAAVADAERCDAVVNSNH